MAPHHIREMVKKLKDVGARLYQGRETFAADGELVQDCADVILEFLAADDDRAKTESYVKAGRVPLQALFTPEDVTVIQGAAALQNPGGNDEAAVADSVAWIVGEWFEGQTDGYLPRGEKESDED